MRRCQDNQKTSRCKKIESELQFSAVAGDVFENVDIKYRVKISRLFEAGKRSNLYANSRRQ